jgi:ClpP class serine protease
MVGSIGVVSVHTFTPSTDKAVVTEIKSGKFKTVGSSSKPLSGDDLAHLQERIDYLATQFINAVAANRGLSASAVAGQEARVYIGHQAVGVGLLDGIASVRELEDELAKDPGRFMRRGSGNSVKATSRAPTPSAVDAKKVVALPEVQKTEFDTRAEAAGAVLQYRKETGEWPRRVMTWAEWEQAGATRASKDGCTVVEGIKREGYVHPYVNQPQTGQRPKQGDKLTLKLSDAQMAERAQAWSDFKGVTFLEAMHFLGFAEAWRSKRA